MRTITPKSCGTGFLSTRLTVAVMMFTASMMSYMLRVNMSINILDMVQPQGGKGKNTSHECFSATPANFSTIIDKEIVSPSDERMRYDWNSNIQGLILGSYFWGYILTSMPAGLAAQRWGPRLVVFITALLSGLLTLLSPLCADLHHGVLVASRLLIGALGGFLYPALHSLVANWAPPNEKGKFIGALMGSNFGTVITWSVCGVIIENIGWRWAFYIPGMLMTIWSIAWFFLIYDTPDCHPRISEKEKSYIVDAIGESVQKTKKTPPFKNIFLSVPFWSFTILHFGSLWGLYFLLTAGPKYISQVLGFDLSKAGIISSLPYMARLLMGFVFGAIGDSLRKRGLLSVITIRKSFTFFSHILPGLLLVLLTYIGCSPILSVVIITSSLGFNGAATITNLQNHQDLAPNHAGVLYGIANCIGSATGFITPAITGYFTRENNGLAEWRSIFLIGAAAYIIAGIVFIIFGTSTIQSWNTDKEETIQIDINNDNDASKQVDNPGFIDDEGKKQIHKHNN